MVDFFEELRKKNKIAADKIKTNAPATIIKPKEPSYLARINHLIEYHLAETSEWEQNFLYSTKIYMIGTDAVKKGREDDLVHILTEKVKFKIAELEAQFCGSICHALNKGGVPHG